MNVPDELLKVRGLRWFIFWLSLNEKGRRALQREIEKQHPHHGEMVLAAGVDCIVRYLQHARAD